MISGIYLSIFQSPTFWWHDAYYGPTSFLKNHVWAILLKLFRNLRKSIEEERKSRRIMEEKISSWSAWSPRNRAKPLLNKV